MEQLFLLLFFGGPKAANYHDWGQAEVEKLKAAKVAYEKVVGEPFPAPKSDSKPMQNKQKQAKQRKTANAKQAAEGRKRLLQRVFCWLNFGNLPFVFEQKLA